MATWRGTHSVATLDAKGRPVLEQAGDLTPISYGHDGRGRLSTVTQGDRTSTLTYDARGNLDTITDPAGRVTAFDHDLWGAARGPSE
ncbi:MAG: hypothetical protein ACOY3Y_05155 [Acidobacteriota bacterium]